MAITRTELHQAFHECISLEFVDVPNNENDIDITFSQTFLDKMDKLIANQKKTYWNYINTARKRVAVFVLIFASLLVSIFANEEVRAAITEWCVEVFDEYNVYYFEGATTNKIVYEYELTMVPDGFEKVKEIGDETCRIIKYRNELGNEIYFEQWSTKEFDYTFDNERGKWLTDTINGNKVELFIYNDMMGAIWMQDGYCFVLVYYECEEIEIIKDMVESVK